MCNYGSYSYSHGELHNLQEFEQDDMSDEPFDDKEDQTTIHRKEDTLESLPNTVSSKTRSLSGQDQSLDDETIS